MQAAVVMAQPEDQHQLLLVMYCRQSRACSRLLVPMFSLSASCVALLKATRRAWWQACPCGQRTPMELQQLLLSWLLFLSLPQN